MTRNLEASGQLFGSYFHQDWVDEFVTDDAAVQAMLESEPKEALAAARNEIRGLLASDLSDAELKMVMTDEVGCYFEPKSNGQTYREWLSEVLGRIEGVVGLAAESKPGR
ncbi:MAG TPA: contact-dependent growth inhibition system immunity protein [Sphingomonadaceae bacterium]|nr:contact-dependent growth inhibition system immunity protein [Sphingomonadaceae bacterium]